MLYDMYMIIISTKCPHNEDEMMTSYYTMLSNFYQFAVNF